MKECEQYRDLISRLVDGELSGDEKARLTEHLRSCEDCAALYEVFSALSRTIGEDLEEPPEELRANVMAKLRRDQIWKKNYVPLKKVLAAAACVAVILLAAGGILPKVLERSASTAVVENTVATPGSTGSSQYQSEYGDTVESEDPALVGNDSGKASKKDNGATTTPKTTNNPQYSTASGTQTPVPVPTVAPTQKPVTPVKPVVAPTQVPVATVAPTVAPTMSPVVTVTPNAAPAQSPAATVEPTASPSKGAEAAEAPTTGSVTFSISEDDTSVSQFSSDAASVMPESSGTTDEAILEDEKFFNAEAMGIVATAPEMDTATADDAMMAPEVFILSLVGNCQLATPSQLQYDENGLPTTVNGDASYPFANTVDYFSGDELTLASLECSLNGTDSDGYTAPADYAWILSQGGVDFVSTIDKLSAGIGGEYSSATSEALRSVGVRSGAQGQSQIITTSNNLKVGIFTTGEPDRAVAVAAVKQLQDDGAEYIVCMFRWNDDGGYNPSESQSGMAHACITAGADLVFGSGSHCVRPVELFEDGLIVYDLGDWISGHSAEPADPDTAMVRLSIRRDADGTVSLDGYDLIPCCQSSDFEAAAEETPGFNDYCPSPYSPDSDEYERTLSKLSGQI